MTDEQFSVLLERLDHLHESIMAGFSTLAGLQLASQRKENEKSPLTSTDIEVSLGDGISMVTDVYIACVEARQNVNKNSENSTKEE